MVCPNCSSTNCHIINEVTTKGKNFSAGKGLLGYICIGPVGVLCGLCGKGKQVYNQNYWVCNNCGNKWKT